MLRLVTLSLALGLAACGMKGPLELPPGTGAAAAKPAMQGGDGSTPVSSSSSARKDTQP